MVREVLAVAAAVLTAVAAAGCSGGEPEQSTPEKSFYVSLGDSLAVGVQPDGKGGYGETKEGYTDALYRSLYDRDSALRHERMGCGGEDTTTFARGGMQGCEYPAGSQLAEAEKFLRENRGRVDLVTVDIGGNNFTGCAYDENGEVATDIDRSCVQDGLERAEEELPEIAERLRSAAGDDVQIIGMTYYNPFLAALLLEDVNQALAEGGDTSDELARYADGVLTDLNSTLTEVYGEQDIDVADVSEAFDSGNFEVPEGSEDEVPANVAKICDFTWMCDVAQGPDIHTNAAGAREIAGVFEEAVRR